jgi:redox-sensitive bicupin YhaK (pirin superfamily)
MKENNNRRNFIQKFFLGVSAMIAAPFDGSSRNTTNNQSMDKSEKEENIVRKISAMGFQWETMDPFLFCVHHEDKFPQGNESMGPVTSLKGRDIGNDFIIKDGFRMYHGKKVPGFPGHPHRGFETITIVREGFVDHADSLGAAGRYGNGDVQWMTAGKGVQHSEMFPLLKTDAENPMELFQIWLNLPRKSKMVDAHFKMLWHESLPNYVHVDDAARKTEVEVIAGNLYHHKSPSSPPNSWAADPQNEVAVWNIHIEPNAEWKIPAASAGVNRMLYFYIGDSIQIAGKRIPKYHSIEVASDVELQIKNANHDSRILLLQGKPINEPVIQYGPFVMNTKEEIQQAFDDFHKTKFGGWPWPKYDQVHDRDSGRFAIHADGKKEVKSN